MSPYYDEGGITIYHGDCREILPTLAPVDLVVTDPPYNKVNRDSSGLRLLDRGEADSRPVDIEWLACELVRVSTGSIYVMCATEQVSSLRAGFVAAGLTTRVGVWHKTNPSPMNGDRLWLSAVELCVFARHEKAWFDRFCKPPVWTGPSYPRDDHPTAKPEWLFRQFITASCPPGGTILDPYMGSGTAVKVAHDEGRRAIGIELDERYCEIAVQRLAQGVLDFSASRSTPT